MEDVYAQWSISYLDKLRLDLKAFYCNEIFAYASQYKRSSETQARHPKTASSYEDQWITLAIEGKILFICVHWWFLDAE